MKKLGKFKIVEGYYKGYLCGAIPKMTSTTQAKKVMKMLKPYLGKSIVLYIEAK